MPRRSRNRTSRRALRSSKRSVRRGTRSARRSTRRSTRRSAGRRSAGRRSTGRRSGRKTRKGSSNWINHVRSFYKEERRRNPAYKYKQAMKDARSTFKR